MIKNQIAFLCFTIFLIGCKPEQKKISSNLIEKSIIKSYRVDTIYQGLNDTEKNALLILYIDSAHIQIDSIILTDCNIHDRRIPFHQIVDSLIVFENCNDYLNTIKILNLEKQEIVSEFNGFIQIIKTKTTPTPIDLDNYIMLFFTNESNNYNTYYVNSLNLYDFSINRLDTLKTSGDPIDGFPVIDKIVPASRKVIVKYIDKDYRNNEDIVLY